MLCRYLDLFDHVSGRGQILVPLGRPEPGRDLSSGELEAASRDPVLERRGQETVMRGCEAHGAVCGGRQPRIKVVHSAGPLGTGN